MKNGSLLAIYKEEVAIRLMNLFTGNKFTDSVDKMLFPNKIINWENDKMKEMLFKIEKKCIYY